MQRYFATLIKNQITLNKDDEHHVLNVMRSKVGDSLQVVVNSKCYLTYIKSINPLLLEVCSEIKENSEIKNDITLFFPLAKGDKVDLVIQKATELGVKKIILFKSEFCVVKMEQNDFIKKSIRYEKIAKEASEQCHRLCIPEILGIVDIKDIKDKYLSDINVFAYEKCLGPSKSLFDCFNEVTNKSVSVIVGPEGGFSKSEADLLIFNKFIPVSLGNRILRCETAAIYSMSVISSILEK